MVTATNLRLGVEVVKGDGAGPGKAGNSEELRAGTGRLDEEDEVEAAAAIGEPEK